MPDIITSSERAAIDAALAAGRARIIPRGQSAFGLDAPMTWRERNAASYAAKKAAQKKAAAVPKPPKAPPKPKTPTRAIQRDLIERRRDRVAECAQRGMSVPEISAHTCLPQRMIRDDLEARKIVPVKAVPPSRKPATILAADERAARLRQAIEGGATMAEAAQIVGCARETARLDLIRIGLHAPTPTVRVSGRQDQIKALHIQHPDWTAPMIAAKVGVMRTYVRKVARKLRLNIPPD